MSRILDEAITWHLASEHDDMDWDAFTLWLEASPDHRAEYDAVARGDAMLKRTGERTNLWMANPQATLPIITSSQGSKRWTRIGQRFGWGMGWAVAAAMAVLAYLPGHWTQSAQTITTGSLSREVALEDGSTITLAPHSSMTLEDRVGRRIRLDGGAYFAIRHVAGRQMEVQAGALTISDIGTRFDVQSQGAIIRVAVSEGQVGLRARAMADVTLAHGQGALFDTSALQLTTGPIAADDVGSWRQGQLSYTDMQLSLVAQDVARYGGRGLVMSDALKARHFSGTLVLGNGHRPAEDLARLMGLELVRGADGDRLCQSGASC